MGTPPQVDDDAGATGEPEQVRPDAVGERCPECGEDVFPKGRQQPAAALAYHRRMEHGVAGKHSKEAKASKKGRAPRGSKPPADGSVTMRDAARDAGSAAGAGRSSTRPPTSTDWEKGIAKLLGYGSMFVAAQMVDGDPRIDTSPEPEKVREELIDRLSLEPKDALAVARLPGRTLSRTNLNRRYGRQALEALDGLDVVFVLGDYLAEVSRYRRERRQMAEGTRPVYGPPPAGNAWDGGAPSSPPAGPPPPTTPGPTAGVVVTPDMVADVRRRRGERVNGSVPAPVPGAGPNE